MKARFGQTIRILPSAPYFVGALARVAYVGNKGVSVILIDSSFDDPFVLYDGEYEIV